MDKTASPRSRTAYEWLARGLVAGVLLGLLVFILLARRQGQSGWVELHGVMSESGGWTPGDLTAKVGEPLRLRLVADDVTHGFAVGQTDWPAIDMHPGAPVETQLVFDQPGKYTFYCTRWCGPSHWRMRGVIEVAGGTGQSVTPPARPLYVTLGLDLDAPHPANNLPARRPDAGQGERLAVRLPADVTGLEYYQTHSPDQAWSDLRNEPGLSSLDDDQLWDLVAALWRSQTTAEALQEGADLYTANCAACHGELGAGDGVLAETLAAAGIPSQAAQNGDTSGMEHSGMSAETSSSSGHTTTQPADFTDAGNLLGASPALLQGKIIRGGMGTGMPYWGPIFTDEQVWSLVAYLWTFQFDY